MKQSQLINIWKNLSKRKLYFVLALFFIAFSAVFIKTDIAFADITAGLRAYYDLDESSGTSAADSSGNASNGLISGGIWTLGKIINALSFNGTNALVSV